MKTIRSRFLLLSTLGVVLFGAVSGFTQLTLEEDANTNAPPKTAVDAAEEPATEAATNADAADAAPALQIRIHKGPIVVFGKNVTLDADESAETVVVIGGSAIIHGDVPDSVVAIGGDITLDGNVSDVVVAVFGNVTLQPKARVGDNAVAVAGTITVSDGAKVGGDAVAVGGHVQLAKGGNVGGSIQDLDIGLPGLPRLEGLGKWVRYCVMELRPLALQVRWVWFVAAAFFLLYLLIAVAFPRPVQACADEVAKRPATTFLVGLLLKLLVPIVVIILTVTGIGVLVIPFLFAALFFGAMLGKVGSLEYLGTTLGRQFGVAAWQKPLIGFVVGSALITVLYLIPILGFVVYTVFGLWGLGAVVMASFAGMRRETPKLPPTAPPPAAQFHSSFANPEAAAVAAAGETPASGESNPTQENQAAPPSAPPPVYSDLLPSLAYPLAGFWERMGAAFLDVVIVAILSALVGGFPLLGFAVAVAYFAGMWAWKGSTIGGIVLKLKVVRQDGGPVNFLVALVRSLAAALSAVVLFLGFFWIAWDPEKQSWHDKIAGTVVVRLPKSVALVCF